MTPLLLGLYPWLTGNYPAAVFLLLLPAGFAIGLLRHGNQRYALLSSLIGFVGAVQILALHFVHQNRDRPRPDVAGRDGDPRLDHFQI